MVTMKDVEQKVMKPEVPKFEVGDMVDVHVRIKEGEKERVQVFTGTVISRRGQGMGSSFTVRRIVQGEGVERVFPLHSPTVGKIEVVRHGHVRRAKLYYLRERTGKATRVKARKLTAKAAQEPVVPGTEAAPDAPTSQA